MAYVKVAVVNGSDQTASLLLDEHGDMLEALRLREARGEYKSVTVVRPRAPKKARGHGRSGDTD